jgi:dTDP-4-amino-4,6-dideoxygalactose transaminase
VLTNNSRLYEPLFRVKHIGYDLEADQGKATSGPPAGLICHNYRGTEFPAAILCGQISGLKALTIQRNRNADILTRGLASIPGIRVQARGRKATHGRQCYYGFMTIVDLKQWAGVTNAKICKALHAEGVPAMGSYGSVYRHLLWNLPKSSYRIHGGYHDKRGPGCKVSEEIGSASTVGFLHFYLDQSKSDLGKVVEAFAKVYRNADALKKL